MVAGATGLVGREILAALLADKSVTQVHSVGRRKLGREHAKLVQHVVDFAHLPVLPKVDDVYIALGTTIKVAGSQAAFRAIDLQAVEALASAALTGGAARLGVVSAMGADTQSRVFYNRVKGEMEVSLARMGYQSLVIARPSMLEGGREALQQAPRPGERIGLGLMRALKPLIPANYRAIRAGDVAQSLIQAVALGTPGVATLLSGELQRH
jgi:uncharacterized protein YbjT (DUF2867 family)